MNKILEAILSDIKNLIKIDNPKKFILSNIHFWKRNKYSKDNSPRSGESAYYENNIFITKETFYG